MNASYECLLGAGPSVSSSVTITNNTFVGLWTAGVWLCSDGGGEHRITGNVLRNYWRGIVLKDVTNTHVLENTLVGGLSDAIILYGAALHNRVERNHIESHVGVGAAGIRVGWVADPLMPLNNLIGENRILRDTIGIHVFGARTTRITKNVIKISGARTAILLTPSTYLGDPGTQPRDTEIVENEIIFIGPCMPVLGCALRLLGVTVPVLVTNNDWGLRAVSDVEGTIWHQIDDPFAGLVTFVPFRNMTSAVTASPTPTPTPAGSVTSMTAGSGSAVASAAGSGTGAAPVRNVPLSAGCTELTWPGVTGTSVADAAMAIAPASAQRTATIARQANGNEWQFWSVARPAASDPIFTLTRGDTVVVCVQEAATWMIVTEIGGP